MLSRLDVMVWLLSKKERERTNQSRLFVRMNASVGNESNGQLNLAALVFLLCLSRESGMKHHIDATSQSWLNRFPDPHNNDVVLTGLAATENMIP